MVANLKLTYRRTPPGPFFQFRQMESVREQGKDIFMQFLSGDAFGAGMPEHGFFWYFGDLIAERFVDALDAAGIVEWGTSTASLDDRRQQCAKLEAEIEELMGKRDALATDLSEAGMKE